MPPLRASIHYRVLPCAKWPLLPPVLAIVLNKPLPLPSLPQELVSKTPILSDYFRDSLDAIARVRTLSLPLNHLHLARILKYLGRGKRTKHIDCIEIRRVRAQLD